jgi:hypothetical protein
VQGFLLSDPIRPLEDSMSGRLSELVQVRVSTDPRCLEELLDCLAGLSFPINPQIYHGVPTIVEFPAYESQIPQVRSALRAYNFDISNSFLYAV